MYQVNGLPRVTRNCNTFDRALCSSKLLGGALLLGIMALPVRVLGNGAAATQPVPPPPHAAAYLYHLDGNLNNSGTSGAAGDLTDNGFTRFVDSAFGQAGFDSPKLGRNHVKVPLASVTDSDGSFTIQAIFQFPETGVNSDPNQARFTIASYGGEEDGAANTSGGGFYLNYNADPALATLITPEHPVNAGRVQFLVDNRIRGTQNAFSRQIMVNALVPVTATAGNTYRVSASWDNLTGVVVLGWSPLGAHVRLESLPPVAYAGKANGTPGLVIKGTSYFLTIGGAEAEDGGCGFASPNIKIDDVSFLPGVEGAAFAASATTTPATDPVTH